MPDFSQLNIKINSSKPVQQLKKVQGSLDKTAEAAQTLTETLKTIGIGIGFGALIKQSLQLNSTLTALNRKFNTLFDNSIMGDVKELASSLNVSNIAAKNAFTTFGQFAQGLGLAKYNIRGISTELTTAAANYAAFNNMDFQETAKKFAKALTGQTGELKDIGIIIDANTESFKKQVEQIQELTGATEAQAKALAISQAIQEQTSNAAGSATAKMFDGWTQLNILLDNFKEVLADVGNIFSTAFGPALKVLNEIMEIPFVKSATAWSIAIVAVAGGYVALIKTIRQIRNLLGDINENTKNSEVRQQALKEIAQQYNKTLKQRLSLLHEIAELQNSQKNLSNTKKYANSGMSKLQDLKNLFDQSSLEKIKLQQELLKRSVNTNSAVIEKLKDSLKDLSPSAKQLSNTFGKVIPNDFMELLITMGLLSKTTKSLTAAIVIETIAKKASVAASKINAVSEGLWAGVMQITTGGIVGITASFKALGTVLGGLGKAILPLTLALGKLLAVIGVLAAAFVIIHDLFKGLVNALSGKDFYDGTISKKIAEWLYSQTNEAIEIAKNQAYLDKLKSDFDDIHKVFADFEKQIAEVNFQQSLKKLNVEQRLRKLQEQLDRLGGTALLTKKAFELLNLKRQFSALVKEAIQLASPLPEQKANWTTSGGMPGTQRRAIDEANKRRKMQEDLDNRRKANEEARLKIQEQIEKLQKEYNEALKNTKNIQNQIEQTQNELNKLNIEYSKKLNQINSNLHEAIQSFSYGYKNGKFGNYIEDTKKNNLAEDIKEIHNRLSKLLSSPENQQNLQTQAQLMEQLFDKRKALGELQLNQLNKQREAAINNFKAMQEIVKQAAGFRSNSQSAVEANSIESMRLQTRQREGLTKQELNPVIEQQKVAQQIEQQMLNQQKTTVSTLSKITDQLIAITGKIGTSKGATNLEIITPI